MATSTIEAGQQPLKPLVEGTGYYTHEQVTDQVAEAKEQLNALNWRGIELFDDSDPKFHRVFPGETGTHYGLVGTEIPLSDTFANKGVELLKPTLTEQYRQLPRTDRLTALFALLQSAKALPDHNDIWAIYAHPDDIQAGGIDKYLFYQRCQLITLQARAAAINEGLQQDESDVDIRAIADMVQTEANKKQMSVNHLVMDPGTGGGAPAFTEYTNPIARTAALARACRIEGSTAIYMPYMSKEPITDEAARNAVLNGEQGLSEWMGFKTDNHRQLFAIALTRTFPISTTLSHEGPGFDAHEDHLKVREFMSHIRKYGPWTKYHNSMVPDNRPYQPEGPVRHFGIRVWEDKQRARPAIEVLYQPDNVATLLGMAEFRCHDTEALSYAPAVFYRDAANGMWAHIDPNSPEARTPLSEETPPIQELSLETPETRAILEAHWNEMKQKEVIPEFHFATDHSSDGTAKRIHSAHESATKTDGE